MARRDAGIRVYEAQAHDEAALSLGQRRERLDALLMVMVEKYAPVPSPTLSWLANRLRIAVAAVAGRRQALARAGEATTAARAGRGARLVLPDEPLHVETDDAVRLLAPFDPIVWDRRRFEAFWGWPYRFEAYTPAARRQYGYYALPLLWRDAVIGWANVISKGGALQTDFGYVAGRRPRGRAFTIALEAELARMRVFLAGEPPTPGPVEVAPRAAGTRP